MLEVRDDEARERQRAFEALRAIHHEELIGVIGQLVHAAQIARRGLEGHVLAHRDVIEIHQRADRAFGIGERRAQPLALLDRQRLDHLLHDAGRQVRSDVGELVRLEGFGGGDQLRRIHAGDERFAHRLRDLEQDLAVAVGLHHVPHGEALLERQSLEDVSDVGRMQGIEPYAQLGAAGAIADQLAQLAELLLQLVDFQSRQRLSHAPHRRDTQECGLPSAGERYRCRARDSLRR